MTAQNNIFDDLDFGELEDLFGVDNARVILRTLETFEGISEPHVKKLSYAARLNNVLSAMKDNMRYHTMH